MRAISLPETIVAAVTPSVIGRISRPEPTALTPTTICRNTGTNTTTANSADVARKKVTVTTRNTELRNSLGGRIGSAALRSHQANASSSTTAPAIRPSVGVDVQA